MALDQEHGTDDLWVFGYGSLMWRPGFPHQECRPALLMGYHRAMCIKSIRYRGTADNPGLVVGLAPGGSCRGRAYRVAAADRPQAVPYLDQRELATGAYIPRLLPCRLDDGRKVTVYAFVATRDHPQFMPQHDREALLALILNGSGWEGRSAEYLKNTVSHLDDMGIGDGPLHALLGEARRRDPSI
ncbi:gamma-glutamylcyclotransferase [Roseospirillum parvum]|uniref:glutathione-specific gamma-glutamylcyclotransferase n=1 Tax=Roseospirillum parvum TaxID=83401 RepID=A0A1G8BSB9_9PROT|nr:gamma-glutamylcyclotransferase [Roseospirillum parvum]SDH36156.1 cation transport protein ChaC [Roseospirillum parvum]